MTHRRISTLVDINKNKEKIEHDLDQKMTSPTAMSRSAGERQRTGLRFQPPPAGTAAPVAGGLARECLTAAWPAKTRLDGEAESVAGFGQVYPGTVPTPRRIQDESEMKVQGTFAKSSAGLSALFPNGYKSLHDFFLFFFFSTTYTGMKHPVYESEFIFCKF